MFAIGNLVHPVDTADIAALDGRHVAEHVRAHLNGSGTPDQGSPADRVTLRWVAPNLIRPAIRTRRGRLLLWTDDLVRIPKVTARQDGPGDRPIDAAWPASPGRVFRVPSGILKGVDFRGEQVELSIQ